MFRISNVTGIAEKYLQRYLHPRLQRWDTAPAPPPPRPVVLPREDPITPLSCSSYDPSCWSSIFGAR